MTPSAEPRPSEGESAPPMRGDVSRDVAKAGYEPATEAPIGAAPPLRAPSILADTPRQDAEVHAVAVEQPAGAVVRAEPKSHPSPITLLQRRSLIPRVVNPNRRSGTTHASNQASDRPQQNAGSSAGLQHADR
jgi:hypothetical protein